MIVLTTRAQDDAERAKAYLTSRGCQILHVPLISINETGLKPPADTFDALIVTSIHGAPFIRFIPNFKSLPIYAVGERTAEAVRQAGAEHIITGAGTALSLVHLIGVHCPSGMRLLQITGVEHKAEPEYSLCRMGYVFSIWTPYQAAEIIKTPISLINALKNNEISMALHYSQRSVAILSNRAGEEKLLDRLKMIYHVFISQDAVEGAIFEGVSWVIENRIAIADKPDEQNLLKSAEKVLLRLEGFR